VKHDLPSLISTPIKMVQHGCNHSPGLQPDTWYSRILRSSSFIHFALNIVPLSNIYSWKITINLVTNLFYKILRLQ